MKKLVLASLLFLLALAASAHAQGVQVACNKTIAYSDITGPLPAQTLIPPVANQVIHFCGWNISNTGGASSSISFDSGTGTDCATGKASANIGITVANGQTNIDHTGAAWVLLPRGNGLCWTITGTGTLNATFYYAQF
jgi:hypothetical protein